MSGCRMQIILVNIAPYNDTIRRNLCGIRFNGKVVIMRINP